MRTLGRAVIIVLPLVTFSAQVQRRAGITPQTITKELVRCLSVVRLAASRRSDPARAHTIPIKSLSVGPPQV
jgi:hypothetical protein